MELDPLGEVWRPAIHMIGGSERTSEKQMKKMKIGPKLKSNEKLVAH